MSSYETAIARMYALGHELAQTPSHKFDLAHMRVLLAALDNPERHFPSVLIAGTNGKGSTAATLASILEASGLRSGLYTSPHLVRINERIQIDGQQIGDDDFALVHDLAGPHRGAPGQRGRVALASQLFRDAHGNCIRALRAPEAGHRGARGRHGRAPGCNQRGGTAESVSSPISRSTIRNFWETRWLRSRPKRRGSSVRAA